MSSHTTPAGVLRTRLRGGEPVIGAMVGTPSADVVEMLGLAGFDFITIDTEHEPFDDAEVRSMIRAADSHRMPVIVRGPMNHRMEVLLNFGAAGVQVPDVGSAEQLSSIVDAVRFAPRGTRPGTLLSRAVGYGSGIAPADADDPVVIAMIEDVRVARDVDALLACDGVDAFYVGPWDLRASMGAGVAENQVRRVIDEVVQRCVSAKKTVAVGVVGGATSEGPVVSPVSGLAVRREQGVGLFVVAVSMFLAQQLAQHRRDIAAALAPS